MNAEEMRDEITAELIEVLAALVADPTDAQAIRRGRALVEMYEKSLFTRRIT